MAGKFTSQGHLKFCSSSKVHIVYSSVENKKMLCWKMKKKPKKKMAGNLTSLSHLNFCSHVTRFISFNK
jgi:hypothetical protein